MENLIYFIPRYGRSACSMCKKGKRKTSHKKEEAHLIRFPLMSPSILFPFLSLDSYSFQKRQYRIRFVTVYLPMVSHAKFLLSMF